MTLETELAQIAHPNTEQQSVRSVPPDVPGRGRPPLPHIAWSTWLRDAGAPGVASFNVAEPGFFQSLDTLLVTTPVADWRVYLRWHVLDATMRG